MLEKAVCDGDFTAAKQLILEGIDVNRRGTRGFTPLMIAAGLGQPDMLELLLKADADPHMIDPFMGATALHKAAQSGNTDVICLLLDYGAFVDQQSVTLGNTPLIDAVAHIREPAVRLLLARGARTTIRNHWQQSALELANEDGSEMIARAIEARNSIQANQVTGSTLITAIKAGDLAEIERMIESGVDLEQRLPVVGRVDDDYTALGVAVRVNRDDIVRLLLDAGADPRREIGLMRGTVVHEASFLGFVDILKTLINRLAQSADLADVLGAEGPYNGLTALHDAIWQGHGEAVRLLIDAAAPLSARSHSGTTPREMAMFYGHDEIARMLTEAERLYAT